MGSGGGLPGIVIAIASADTPTVFSLVESDQRKCAFLRTVVRELRLKNVRVLPQRIEVLAPLAAGHISARALAPLPSLVSYVKRHLKPDGHAWLMKGESWPAEVDAARQTWQFDLTPYASKTREGAAILKLSNIRP